jgi:hypothetical protein
MSTQKQILQADEQRKCSCFPYVIRAYSSKKTTVIQVSKLRRFYLVWRYRPRYVARYILLNQAKLHRVVHRVHTSEVLLCENDAEEAEVEEANTT